MSLFDRIKNKLNEAPENPSGLDFEGQSEKFVENERNKKKTMRGLEKKSNDPKNPLKGKNVKKGETTGTPTPKRGATTITRDTQLDLFTGKEGGYKETKVKTTYDKTGKYSKKKTSSPTLPGFGSAKKIEAATDAKDAEIEKLDKKTIKAKPGAAKKESDLIDYKKKSLEIQKKSLLNKSKKYASGEYPRVGDGESKKITKTGNTNLNVVKTNVNLDPKPNKSKGRGTGTATVKPNISPKKKITGDYKQSSATKYTQKINQANPNRPEYVPQKTYDKAIKDTKKINPGQTRPLGTLVKKTKTASDGTVLKPGNIDFSKSAELAAKRKARIDSKTGRATQAGVFDYAKNRGGFDRISKGVSRAEFQNRITNDPKMASKFKKIVTKAKEISSNPSSKEYKKIEDTINKSDYAGKFAKRRNPTTNKKSKGNTPVKVNLDKDLKTFNQGSRDIKKVYGDKVVTSPPSRSGVISIRGSAAKNPLPEVKPTTNINKGYLDALRKSKGTMKDGEKLKNLPFKDKVFKLIRQSANPKKVKQNLKILSQVKNPKKLAAKIAIGAVGVVGAKKALDNAPKVFPGLQKKSAGQKAGKAVIYDRSTGQKAKFKEFGKIKMPASEFKKKYYIQDNPKDFIPSKKPK